MPRKRHTEPEALLSRVIQALERDDADRRSLPAYGAAVRSLLSRGPLIASETLLRVLTERMNDADVLTIRAELLAFLRTIVRERRHGRWSRPISTYRPVNFSVLGLSDGAAVCGVDGDVRDVVIVQLVLLLHEVGLAQLRLCPASGCQRMFVKTYRREFCSRPCQNRMYMADQRQADRERREYYARARRRRLSKGR